MTQQPEKAEDRGASRLHFLRVTLEATSPLAIASGELLAPRTRLEIDPITKKKTKETPIYTTALMRDANGLPAIPGSSWQGVMRQLFEQETGDARQWFGYETGSDDGKAGRLVCGWGHVHDGKDQAVTSILDCDSTFNGDRVLELLAQPAPIWRDHVALDDRLVVDGARKYARAAVPVGTRFSIEISGWGDDGMETVLHRIASLFRHPRMRLGGATRRGYGRFDLIRASYAAPDLHDADRLRWIRNTPPSALLATRLDPKRPEDMRCTTAVLKLSFPDFLRIGGATEACAPFTQNTAGARNLQTGEPIKAQGMELRLDRNKYKDADDGDEGERSNLLLMLTEPRLEWKNDSAQIDNGQGGGSFRFPIPGSAIKGVIAHRFQYHLNREKKRVIDVDALLALDDAELDKRLAELRAPSEEATGFLGTAKGPPEPGGTPGPGMAAGWSVDDSVVADVDWVMAVDHASLDRFTSGVRSGALFAEELLLNGNLAVSITIEPPRDTAGESGSLLNWPEPTVRAFLRTLHDLCDGRLAIGGRSHGFVEGGITWSGAQADGWETLWADVSGASGQAGREAVA